MNDSAKNKITKDAMQPPLRICEISNKTVRELLEIYHLPTVSDTLKIAHLRAYANDNGLQHTLYENYADELIEKLENRDKSRKEHNKRLEALFLTE